jgi:LysR family transcriptional regulator, glycine cleavage system transcriptional activator
MSETLPPLAALRVFEAAARHLNFTRAADELGMTQAAVSYQIKILEERMGAPLFLRQPRHLALTETGERLAPGIMEAFVLMRTSVAASRQGAQTMLSITTFPTFATEWLATRLGGFQLLHPDIAVRLEVGEALVDFNREPFDVGIRGGEGEWPGLVSHLLLESTFTPMLAPSLAEKVKEPADILKLNLIDNDDPWWAAWFAAAGIAEKPSRRPTLNFNSQALAAAAATAGHGVAILTPAFHRNEMARGELVQPFDLVCSQGRGYYLVYPEARRNAPHIAAFRTWILAQAPIPQPVANGRIATPMTA